VARHGPPPPLSLVAFGHGHRCPVACRIARLQAELERRVAEIAAAGGGINVAMASEIDDVIDPAESRRWISTLLL